MIQQRKQLVQALNALKKQRQMLNNQLHALAQLPLPLIPQGAKEAYEAVLSTAEEQIKLLEEQLDELGDEEYDQQLKRLCSVVGIGQRTARALILATGGLQRFKHSRQLSKFIGLVPATHRSGSSVFKKGRITKKGQPELRATLYMAAMSAKRFNMACKDLYERLRAKGKPHKQAMVAVMNKLVKQAYGVIVNNTDFDNEYYLKFQE